ncbi:MAG TPA: SdrD B-like domain-containing protein [Pyrinomonadaceae bacterium]|nr:SdrD B-like domain-containing protein [Pyrinomonadaceae bacterium]
MRYQARLSSLYLNKLKANTRKIAVCLLLAALIAPSLLLPQAATAARQRAKGVSEVNSAHKDSTSALGQIEEASNAPSSLPVASALEPQATPTPNYGGIIFGHGYFNSISFYKVNPDGSNRISLTDLGAGQVHDPSVSQTGTIAFDAVSLNGMVPSMTDPFQGTRIFVMNGDGSGVRQLTFAPNPGGEADNTKDFFPKISPDGSKVAFISRRKNGLFFHACQNGGWGTLYEQNEVYVVNTDGTGLQQITFPDSEFFDAGDEGCGLGTNFQVDWMPDGQHLVIFGTRPYRRYSGDTRPGIYNAIVAWTESGRLATLYGDDPKNDPANQNLSSSDPAKRAVGLVTGNQVGQFDVAPDGRILFPSAPDNSLGLWVPGTPLAGGINTQTIMGQVGFNGSTDGLPHGGAIENARFSPDGTHLVICGWSPLANNNQIRTLFIDGGSAPIPGLGSFMQFNYGLEWVPGPPIPQPAQLTLVPNPVLNYFQHRTHVTPYLMDAQGNVISKSALWRSTDQCPTCGFRCDNSPDQIACTGSWFRIGNSSIDFTGTINGADLDARTNLCASNAGIRTCVPYINHNGAILSVNATTPTAFTSGSGGSGVFTITREGDPTAASMTGPLTFSFSLAGTAQRDVDYTLDFSGNSVTIPSGQNSVTINVRPIGAHGDKTVILNLLPDQTNSYSLSTLISATVSIEDDGLPPAPFSLSMITPNSGGDQGVVSATVYGRGIQQGATVKLSRSGQADINGENVNVASGGSAIKSLFNLMGREQGVWDVVVTNPDGTSATLNGAFTVQATALPNVWINISGRDTIRASHTATTYTVAFGNSGNVDAFFVPLIVTGIPTGAEVQVLSNVGQLPGIAPEDTVPTVIPTETMKAIAVLATVVRAGSTNYLRFTVRFAGIDQDTSFKLKALALDPLIEPASPTVSKAATIHDGRMLHHANAYRARSMVMEQATSFQTNRRAIACFISLVTTALSCVLGKILNIEQCALNLASFVVGAFNSALQSAGFESDISIWGAGSLIAGGASTLVSCLKALGTAIPLYNVLSLLSCAVAVWDTVKNTCWASSSELDVTAKASHDPNEKVGPRGTSDQHYIPSSQPVPYSIFFENQETATAPAQTVVVTDHLDASKLDLSTFSLGLIGFGDKVVTPPAGLQNYDTDIDLRPGKNLIVRIHAALDIATAVATWQFQSIDPATGQPTTDPNAGFLPPDIDGIVGEGSVLFSVLPKPGLAAGTQINNQARITFDLNAPMDTNNFTNTIDDSKPSSSVAGVSAPNCGTSFPVQWSGRDTGSGIGTYTIFVSDNGGPFTEWLTNTSDTSATYVGVVGHTYGFYSTARDNAGNIEAAPATADTLVTLNANTPPVITYTNQNVTLGGSLNINPSSGPSDNGAVASIALLNQGTYTGGINVNNSTGAVSLTNAAPAGIHTITIRATDNCGATTDATLQISVNSCSGSISGNVFFDFNANGLNNGEPALNGWKVVLSGATSMTTYTNASGYYSFAGLTAGTYTVTATPPSGTWTATTPTSRTFTVDCANQSNAFVADFGDYCKVPSGGLGIGFWTSKNGQALITIADLCALNALHLRNANGSDFDPVAGCPAPTNQQLKTGIANLTNWLNGATSTNMSNMLSAQLAATVLNVRHGYLNANSFDLCHGTTINQLILDADASLAANGNTTASQPARTAQEILKNCLNALNNGSPVIPSSPCQVAFLSALFSEPVETSVFKDQILRGETRVPQWLN